MRKQQTGFTLIELVAVIVILGILAAVALPRFINLQDEAAEASTQAVAGNLSSASSINLAGALAGDTGTSSVTNCQQVGTLLEGGLPDGYAIPSAAGGGFGGVTGDAVTCTVTNTPEGALASFRAFEVPDAP